jgi:hypothetical protein
VTELASAREKGKMSSFLLILCTDHTEIEGGYFYPEIIKIYVQYITHHTFI